MIDVHDTVLRRVVFNTLEKSKDGLGGFELRREAKLENLSVQDFYALLHAMAADAEIACGSCLWVVTDSGRRGYRDERYLAKHRTCMSCRKSFWSSDCGNRICQRCVHVLEIDGSPLDGDYSSRGVLTRR